MKKIALFFLVVALSNKTIAQNFFFAKANYTDSVALQSNIPSLAKQVLQNFKQEENVTYYDNAFRYQLVANDFKAAMQSLNALRELSRKQDPTRVRAYGFGYEVYIDAIANEPSYGFNATNYEKSFSKIYDSLPYEATAYAAAFYANSFEDISKNYKKLLNDLNKSDSISFSDAKKLCRSYTSFKVVGLTKNIGVALIKKEEQKLFIIEDSVLIKTKAGVTLSATVVRKRKNTGKLPVVLLYNIYAGGDIDICKTAALKDYVGIVVNTRGKRLSPDVVEPLEHDAEDAYDMMDWISKQLWSNGKIGMYGGSYLGFSQWASTKNLHPALKTIVPQVSVGPGVDYPMFNNIFENYMLRWIHFVENNKLIDSEEFGDNKKWQKVSGTWFKEGRSFRSLDTIEGRPNKIFQRWLQHPAYDKFWQNMVPQKAEYAKINIPILTTTGYYDDDQLGAMYYYKQHHLYNEKANHYLLIGPYDHGGGQGYIRSKLGGYDIDKVAEIDLNGIVFEWFNYIMKDSAKPAMLKDKVNFEVMGKNEWKHVSSLDKMHNDSLILYLGNRTADSNYILSKVKSNGFILQQVDLKDRTDMRFREEDVIAFTKIIHKKLDAEKDKLIFVSDSIVEPFAISGSISASLNVSINKKDFDIVINVYEQMPDGKFMALNETIQRASFAKDRTKRQLLQPNKIENIVVDRAFLTSRQLQKGSRIVVLIGVNKSPNYQINYGTGKDVSDETMADAKVPLEIKWFKSSFIKIPILNSMQ
jgi:uncharacterized protein